MPKRIKILDCVIARYLLTVTSYIIIPIIFAFFGSMLFKEMSLDDIVLKKSYSGNQDRRNI